MKIAFVINQTHKETARFTTTLLALKAHQMGHEIYYIGLADFYYESAYIAAHVRKVLPDQMLTSANQLMEVLRTTEKTKMILEDMDVVWLRFDPVLDMVNRPWAAASALQFAALLKEKGVWVINDPDSLSRASNKLYLEGFDESIRPKTIVTRNYTDVIEFFEQQNKLIILKPLKGSGGKNVFLINKDNQQNLKQTVEAIARDGYVIGQEYLPEASRGDIRFFLLNGEPISINGKYAAVHRVQQGDEIRSNVHQGAKTQAAIISPELLVMVDKIRYKLVQDGMYFVGLDVVGDRIMEINVFSPGALCQTEEIVKEDFSALIIKKIAERVAFRERG
ncbi:ATP-grasp domain-containing protein [Sphingobacterium multivorum]|uniref:Glutathione synthetase n=1 Tax=Sphingobacterium multivorum TaxID=28454 RepID=A0A2X2L7D2_SPHMU|nr:glutathione synthase [Sphingobacterium multivorum]QRQ59495.1 glutathione synthase [Sphingobacterium multivorum]SPZ85160.1 Glutathione synthetase [Sphingobacterium multivorum]